MIERIRVGKKQIVFYEDEVNDDFMDNHLTRPKVSENYKFKRTNKFNNFFSALIFYGFAKPILSIVCILRGIKIINREELKKVKDVGAFIYMNHTNVYDMFEVPAYIVRGKRTNTIGYSDTTTIPFVKHLTRALGYIPLPSDLITTKKFIDALDFYVNKEKQHILIFPEAHVWPYYTKIRPFGPASFHYPAKFNAPVVPMVTTYKKSKFRKKPKIIIYVGKVIYPLEEATPMENKKYLHEECYKQMVELSNSYKQFEYIKYIKTEPKS